MVLKLWLCHILSHTSPPPISDIFQIPDKYPGGGISWLGLDGAINLVQKDYFIVLQSK